MLTGRTLETHAKMFGIGSSATTRQDWLAVRSTFLNFDEVMRVLRALPTSLILILRNINIVRSINRELGCPVNRFNIMARRLVKVCSLKRNLAEVALFVLFCINMVLLIFPAVLLVAAVCNPKWVAGR